MKISLNFVLILSLWSISAPAQYSQFEEIQYIFPKDSAQWIVQESPVIVRFNNIRPDQLDNCNTFISARGNKSGIVSGKTIISSDRKTFIFKPDHPFIAGEKISVTLSPCLTGKSESFLDSTITFYVAANEILPVQESVRDNVSPSIKSISKKRYTPNNDGVVVLNGVSVPSDFPYIDITINDNPDPGYIFCNYEGDRYFNMILDNSGAPYFYWVVPDDRRDFKVQETGVLTMTVRQGFGGGGYIAVDNTYSIVDTFFAPAGYRIDEHELLVLANGHYLITAMDTRTIDMSQVIAGGRRNANVIGYHLIEMDAHDIPVFIWRCWDHYQITDAENVDLTQQTIDYLHTNSIAVDLDGHYLISSKLLDEITKINRNTGEIIWRLGGKKNQFDYVNFDEFISRQHSIRVLPNGNYMVFDNGNYHVPHYSRALEFKVDTDDMTVTKIWEFRDTPDKQSDYKGNAQRLPSGNTLINWGMQELPKLTEVRPDGSKAYEMNFANPVQSYRVFRFPWQANAAVPFLVVEPLTDKVTLLFNKFGDPDVKEYRIYGGPTVHPNTVMRTTSQPYSILDENDFTESEIYYFRVTAIDSHGNESGFSNEEQVNANFIPVNTNMISNGEFEDGRTRWKFDVFGSAAATMTTSDNACSIEIAEGGSDLSDIRLSQDNLTLYQGQTYTFEFDAWADKARPLDAKIESTNPPFTNYGQIGLSALTSDKKHFVYTFTMENATTNQARVVFNAGQEESTIYLDNVVLFRTKPTDVRANHSEKIPLAFILHPVYPNPFNLSTSITYQVSSTSKVELSIYNLLGQKAATLVSESQPAGQYQVKWDATGFAGGIYFCRLTAKAITSGRQFYQVRKMMLLK
jgi:hypothetical protein